MTDFDPWAQDALLTDAPPPDAATALAALVAHHGPMLIFDPDLLVRSLERDAPSSTFEIAVIMTALAHEVPQEIMAAHGATARREVRAALVDRLVQRAALDRETATGVVRTWTGAVEARPTRDDVTPAATVRSVESPTPGGVTRDDGRDGLGVPFAVTRVHDETAPHDAGIDRPGVDFMAPALDEPTIIATPRFSADPRPGATAPSTHDIPREADVDPVAVDALVGAVIDRLDRDVERRPRASRWSIAVPIAAIALVAALASFVMMYRMTSERAAVADGTTKIADVAGKTTSPGSAPAISPTLDTTPSTRSPAETATAPRPATPGPSPVDATRDAETSSRDGSSSGTPEAASLHPPDGTTGGSASPAPSFAPVPAVTIARLDPLRATSDRAAEMLLRLDGDPASLAAVETVALDAAGRTGSVAHIDAAALRRTRDGRWRLPVATTGAAALQVRVVDRSGTRSDAREVAMRALRPPSLPTRVPVADTPSDTCTRLTCGTIVDVRELDGGSAFVTTVRTDDGTTRSIVEGTRRAVGTAVRRLGERFVPIRIGG